MQTVGHDGDVAKAREHRHHLQYGATRIQNNRVAIVYKTDGGFGNLLFFMRID